MRLRMMSMALEEMEVWMIPEATIASENDDMSAHFPSNT